jgi:hypothetical protein
VWLAAGGIYWDGGVIGWALRWVLSCCGVALLCTGFLKLGPEFFLDRATKSQPVAHPVEISSPVNTLVYPANEQGHVILDAAVNGASMRLLVDTGASLVTLTPADAHSVRHLGFLRGFERPAGLSHKPDHGRSRAPAQGAAPGRHDREHRRRAREQVKGGRRR